VERPPATRREKPISWEWLVASEEWRESGVMGGKMPALLDWALRLWSEEVLELVETLRAQAGVPVPLAVAYRLWSEEMLELVETPRAQAGVPVPLL